MNYNLILCFFGIHSYGEWKEEYSPSSAQSYKERTCKHCDYRDDDIFVGHNDYQWEKYAKIQFIRSIVAIILVFVTIYLLTYLGWLFR